MSKRELPRCGFGDVRSVDGVWRCRICQKMMPHDYEAVLRATCTRSQIKAFEESTRT